MQKYQTKHSLWAIWYKSIRLGGEILLHLIFVNMKLRMVLFLCAFSLAWSTQSCAEEPQRITLKPQKEKKMMNDKQQTETAILGAGCFWCVEAVYQQLNGVISVQSGYCGGTTDKPTYKEVCTGTTGHAEVCKVVFDPSKISFTELLEVFWSVHDPTTLNRQGADVGTQYRSAIFYTNAAQKELAETYKKQLDASNTFTDPIVTQITSAAEFFPAEDYHADYFNRNPNQGYCTMVVRPKVEKFKKAFSDKLKK